MKIDAMSLFHTPKNWNELVKWIERHVPEERPHLLTAAGMAWNLAVKVSEMTEEEAAAMKQQMEEEAAKELEETKA